MKISEDKLSVTFENVDEALKHLDLMGVKVGARHSASDAKMLQGMHDYCVGLGASCEKEEGSKSTTTTNVTDGTATIASYSYTPVTSGFVQVVEDEADKQMDTSYAKSLGMDISKNMAVKYISRDEIKGYTFMWGNPELTDVEIEYFTQGSDFWDDKLGKSSRPLTWDHATTK